MPPKPNYNHQRAERDRAKRAAKEAKLQERKQRKANDAATPQRTDAPAPAVEPAKPE